MIDYVIDILEWSLKNRGDKPLTVSHMLNILKMAKKKEEKDEHRSYLEGCAGDIY